MKLMRLAMWVAIFAVIGGTAFSGDMDIQALQAKLAAQEARLNDLQAKMNSKGSASEATGVVSIRKNAVVKIGGQLNTRYYFSHGRVKNSVTGATIRDINTGDFRVSDAKINFAVQVNDYFDAFFQLNLGEGWRGYNNQPLNSQGGVNTNISIAQRAWIRWKNVCNSGFGLLVGRGDLVFGAGNLGGMVITGWTGGNDMAFNGWALANVAAAGPYPAVPGFAGPSTHQGWDVSRTTQVTPFWEGLDGKVKFEASFFQAQDYYDGARFLDNRTGTYVDSINWGFGSTSARLTVKPIEGLTLVASGMNKFKNGNLQAWPNVVGGNLPGGDAEQNNDTSVNFGFSWKPCFFPRMSVFGQWIHTWNAGWNKDRDADVINAGLSFGLTEQLRFVLQGDYIRVRDKDTIVANAAQLGLGKTTGWAIYPAIRYTLPYGVHVEVGYRYEDIKWKDRVGTKQQTGKLHTAYGQLGFDF